MRRLAKLALEFYPLAFRRRYGEEMRALIEDQEVGLRALLDVLWGALAAHLRPSRALTHELEIDLRLKLGLSAVLACWVAFAAAGFAFAVTTEDQPFQRTGVTHPLLGVTHSAIQVLAVLASGAVLLGAAPLLVAALRRARAEGGRLRALVIAPFAALFALAAATALLVAVSGGEGGLGDSTAAHAAGVVWNVCVLAFAVICVTVARRVLLQISVARGHLWWALLAASAASAAMAAIALAAAIYAVALPLDAPTLSGSPNGPLSFPSVAVSVVLELAAMVLFGGLAMTVTVRAWRAREAALS